MSEQAKCRWDGDAGDYLRPGGDPCKRDDYGDPTHHCQSRRTCSQHVGKDELTCARCLGRTRTDILQIVERSALMLEEAMESGGVNSEAANLAGPGGDYEVFSRRRRIAKAWIDARIHQSARGWCDDEDCRERHFKTAAGDRWHKRGIESAYADLIDDDDEQHPYSVLTRWEFMLREDYGQPRSTPTSIAAAADYLLGKLNKIAQDPEQDWALFAREIRKCRAHMESALHDSQAAERGAPCPTCAEAKRFIRLQREYAHWCEADDCERIHFDTAEGDRWTCPRDREHWWSEAAYRNYVEERKGA